MVSALTLLLPLGLAGSSAPAKACETAFFSAVDSSGIQISNAERALSQGRHGAAVVGVTQTFPKIATMKPGSGSLSDRGLRIVALAAVRTDGAITVGKELAGTTAEGREKNLLFAIDTLRKLSDKRAKNPSFQTDLAEALSKVPRFKAEAYDILSELAKKDLVASAEGYSALARLRDAMGENDARDAAVKRCEGMTKTPKACQVPAANTDSTSS
jgi:hypothetical protein